MTNTAEILIGVVVTLKSGSPNMTVTEVIENNITCVYYDGHTNQIYYATLSKDSVSLAS